MVHGPWVDLKTDLTLHKKEAKPLLTSNYVCTPRPQIAGTLHIFTKIYIKTWVFNPKTDLGDPIPIAQ